MCLSYFGSGTALQGSVTRAHPSTATALLCLHFSLRPHAPSPCAQLLANRRQAPLVTVARYCILGPAVVPSTPPPVLVLCTLRPLLPFRLSATSRLPTRARHIHSLRVKGLIRSKILVFRPSVVRSLEGTEGEVEEKWDIVPGNQSVSRFSLNEGCLPSIPLPRSATPVTGSRGHSLSPHVFQLRFFLIN